VVKPDLTFTFVSLKSGLPSETTAEDKFGRVLQLKNCFIVRQRLVEANRQIYAQSLPSEMK